jgi:rubredoxin
LAREMAWVEQDRFCGWACSVCAWVFNGSGPPVGRSIDEMKQRYETERDKEFKSHVCAAHPRAKKPDPPK